MLKRWMVLMLLLGTLATPAAGGVCEDWNDLYTQIRDFKIAPTAAQAAFAPLHQRLRETYDRVGIGGTERFYPVLGYDVSWGEHGAAYRPRGYQFFSGNPQGFHPSLDLFILDRNQDNLDDRSQRPVTIVAFSGGVVVGVNEEWEFPSPQRGGKYVWIFDPTTDRYNYYAHLAQVQVHLGQIVQAGEPLGLLGRTGLNAYKKRSPTHLHLTVLNYRQGEMVPSNPWSELVRARLGRRDAGLVAKAGK
jgi:peptidoglycan LD-endopeptidase LytH